MNAASTKELPCEIHDVFKCRGIFQGSLDQTIGHEEGREDGGDVTLKLKIRNYHYKKGNISRALKLLNLST